MKGGAKMNEEQASDKQKNYAKSLGINGYEHMNRKDLGVAIDLKVNPPKVTTVTTEPEPYILTAKDKELLDAITKWLRK